MPLLRWLRRTRPGAIASPPRALHLARMARRLSESVTVYTNGDEALAKDIQQAVEPSSDATSWLKFDARPITRFKKGDLAKTVIVHFGETDKKTRRLLGKCFTPEVIRQRYFPANQLVSMRCRSTVFWCSVFLRSIAISGTGIDISELEVRKIHMTTQDQNENLYRFWFRFKSQASQITPSQ